MTIHYLAGLPRSGSTLLGNILSQHPEMHVTGTSPLYPCVEQITNVLSNNPEVIGNLREIPDSYNRYLGAIRAFMNNWHTHTDKPNVMDKHRGWPHKHQLLMQLDEMSQIVCCIRDPRDIVASFEKQERKTALFNSPVAPTLYEYADKVMSPDGMVGAPLRLMEDMIRRRLPVVWVRYESFMADPRAILADVTELLGLSEFTYDLDNIENVSDDMDEIYRNKFPHIGSGALRQPEGHWSEVMNDEMGNLIAGVAPLFMQTFAYRA